MQEMLPPVVWDLKRFVIVCGQLMVITAITGAFVRAMVLSWINVEPDLFWGSLFVFGLVVIAMAWLIL